MAKNVPDRGKDPRRKYNLNEEDLQDVRDIVAYPRVFMGGSPNGNPYGMNTMKWDNPPKKPRPSK